MSAAQGMPDTSYQLKQKVLLFLRSVNRSVCKSVCVALSPCSAVTEHRNRWDPAENKGKSHTSSNKLSSFRKEL